MIERMKVALNLLTGFMKYEAPDQDLCINHPRIPAIPKSRFRIKKATLMG